MKLKKIEIDGRVVYVEVKEDDSNNDEITEEYDEETIKDEQDNKAEERENLKDKININNIGGFVNGIMKNVSATLTSTFNTFDHNKTNNKTAKLLKVIPFLDDEDIHDLMQQVLNDDEALADIDMAVIVPFLSDEDCNALFMKCIQGTCKTININGIAPFVSSECLSIVVDKYVNGELPDLEVDGLYPFLESKDVKKLFYYILNKKN